MTNRTFPSNNTFAWSAALASTPARSWWTSVCARVWSVTRRQACPEHQGLSDDGFVALVECCPLRSGPQTSGCMKPEQGYHTGRLARLKREMFADVFNVPIEDKQPCMFVEPGVIEQLQAMAGTCSVWMPVKSQCDLPRAMGLIWFSNQLFEVGGSPSSMKRVSVPAPPMRRAQRTRQ